MSLSSLRSMCSLALLCVALCGCVTSATSATQVPSYVALSASSGSLGAPWTGAGWQEEELLVDEGGGFFHGVLLYLPNRIFDVFDIVRARLRLGPGIGVGVRVTELADVYVGLYTTVWAGLRGPRGEPKIPWPVGFESKSGAEVSVVDATISGPMDPDYGLAEIGLDLQVAIVGVAVGVDPFELLDLVLGIFTIDLAEDDY